MVASAEEGYPLSTPQPGWAEQEPDDWLRASETALARARRGVAAPRVLRPDARARLPRRAGTRAASGDPLERPAHGRRVRGDRGARRARAPDRADRESRADGLHRAEAAVAAPPRASGLRAHPPRRAAEGLRPPAPDRRVGDRRRGRLGHAALRRRRTTLERRGPVRARAPARMAAAGQRVDRDRRCG